MNAQKLPSQSFFFNLYQRIYDLTDRPECQLKICIHCKKVPCEIKNEKVVFLPLEEKFICHKLKQAGYEIKISKIKQIAYKKTCPFFDGRWCTIHKFRPFDCRSYPIIPMFDTVNSWNLSLSTNCPYCDDLPSAFIDIIKKAWRTIIPYLSPSWEIIYNKIQPSTQIPVLPFLFLKL